MEGEKGEIGNIALGSVVVVVGSGGGGSGKQCLNDFGSVFP